MCYNVTREKQQVLELLDGLACGLLNICVFCFWSVRFEVSKVYIISCGLHVYGVWLPMFIFMVIPVVSRHVYWPLKLAIVFVSFFRSCDELHLLNLYMF